MKRRKKKDILPLYYGFSGLALITILCILLGMAHYQEMESRDSRSAYKVKS